MGEVGRLRWKLWAWLSKRRGVCPANAHSRVVMRIRERSISVDDLCRRDLAANGTCWCGKLTEVSEVSDG